MPTAQENRKRVLLLAFPAMEEALGLAVAAAGLPCQPCPDAASTVTALDEGVALLIVTADLLAPADIDQLAAWYNGQPLWSALPLLLLVPDPDHPPVALLARFPGAAVLLPETCSSRWLQAAIAAAWKSRQRQYELAGAMPEKASSGPAYNGAIMQAALAAAEVGVWDYYPLTGLIVADATCHGLFGLEDQTALDLPGFIARVQPQDRPAVEAALAAAFDPAGSGHYEIDFRVGDTETRWLTATGQTSFREGVAERLVGIVRDRSERRRYEEGLIALNETLEEKVAERTSQLLQEIAERERAEEQLQQSQKMEAVGQLTGGIAHDFNNLLGAVMGNLELLRSRLSDQKLLRFVENALQAVNRGARLTAQLLAFSRLRAVTLKPVDINALVTGLDELLTHTLGAGIVIEVALAPGLPAVLTDATQLELSLLNLAINARDAMQQAGKLVIETGLVERALPGSPEKAPMVAISVTDTGCGMTAEIMARVFEPFFTTKEAGKGTGLGLSQVQGMVRQCGGLVELASTPGQGTIVTMLLPAAIGTALPAAPANEFTLLPTGASQKVLVLDDDADISTFIGDCLRMLGYQPLLASDGPAGLALLATEEPAAAIVDYAMPGMNGAVWVGHALRLQPALAIVFATGHVQTDVLQEACPAAPLLRKPFRIDSLAVALNEVMGEIMPHDAAPANAIRTSD